MVYYPSMIIYGQVKSLQESHIAVPEQGVIWTSVSSRPCLHLELKTNPYDCVIKMILPRFSDISLGEYLRISGTFQGDYEEPDFSHFGKKGRHNTKVRGANQSEFKQYMEKLTLDCEVLRLWSEGNTNLLRMKYFSRDQYNQESSYSGPGSEERVNRYWSENSFSCNMIIDPKLRNYFRVGISRRRQLYGIFKRSGIFKIKDCD